MLTTATVHSDVRCAAAVYADTCSFTLSALSPQMNLWDAIPRDIDSVRYESSEKVREYCQRLALDAEAFTREIRTLQAEKKLVVIEPVKKEVQGQKGRTHGLKLRAPQRFPYAPPDLVRKSLSFQMAAHDAGLAAQSPKIEKKLTDEIMRRLSIFWRELDARFGPHKVSMTDRMLFSTAAANAVMIENGSAPYGTVVLVSRDFNHVFRMYRSREELLKPICRKLRLLYPRNFLFKPTFQDIGPTAPTFGSSFYGALKNHSTRYNSSNNSSNSRRFQ